MVTVHPHHDMAAERRVPTATIPYKRLSNEVEHPFLKHGNIPSSVHLPASDYRAYRRAVEKFPNVQSCLIRSERVKEHPNLLLFDWDEIHSLVEGEVCLFRISSSYGDLESTGRWLEHQRFDVDDPYESPVSSIASPEYAGGRWSTVVASWDVKENGTLFYNNIAEKLARELFEYGISVGVTAADTGDVVNVNVVSNSL